MMAPPRYHNYLKSLLNTRGQLVDFDRRKLLESLELSKSYDL
jgi:hypothetical protein